MRVFAVLAMAFMVAVNAHAVQIFYESFEDPVIDGSVTTIPTGWTTSGGGSHMTDAAFTGKTGDQFGMVAGKGEASAMTTTTDILSSTLTANTRYTITCDVGWNETRCGQCIMKFSAGSTVLGVMTNEINKSTYSDLSKNGLTITFVATNGHPNIGETLSVSLWRDQGWGNSAAYFDNLSLDATTTTGDSTKPTPDPMVFDGLPTSSVSNSITMQATNAVDENLVQYFFTNTVNGNVSGWQDSPIWTDADLTAGVTYSYKVRARDKSANMNINTTQWSSAESAECEPHIILYESFENPSIVPQRTSGEYAAWRNIGADGFTEPTYWAPEGWTYNIGSDLGTYNEGLGKTNTPFGAQYVEMRASTAWIGVTNLGHVFEAGYTYRITCNVFYEDNRSDQPNDGRWQIDLIAGTNIAAGANVVASNILATSTAYYDFSNTNMLEFIPDDVNPNLGDSISIKLWASSTTFYADRGCFDNVKVYAIPPPSAGTLFIFE